ncbi:MAG: beta-lactamase family protein [Candidatus Aminicenantes bacterium]|nr:beta-lactamase family protein [Candidatus Aminicenantes bacterium]
MKAGTRWFLAGCAALALASGLSSAFPGGHARDSRSPGSVIDAAKLDSFLAQAAGEWKKGCSLLLVRDGKTIYEKSFGGFDSRKPFPIASATKWLTGSVILSLMDEGKLGLGDPVSRYLPEFDGEKARITVRQLLSHTSGLPMADPALERRDITLKQAVEAIAAAPLMSAPGQVCMYGDVSVQVAGRIAEIASGLEAPSGRVWKTLFTSRLSVPLEMTGTFAEGSAPTDNPHLAGGATSTAGDYANFLVMLLDKGEFRGRRVLSEAAVAEMFRDQTGGSSLRFNPFQSLAELHPGWREVRYGLCNWLEAVDGATGKTLEASSPGVFGFCPWIDFGRHLVGVFASDSGMEKALPVYLRLKALIRREIPI